MAHVFISYVRENQDQVDALCQALRTHGVQVWLDREQIRPGARWQQAIREAIQEGAFFLACFSEAYQRRTESYMNEELTLAIDQLRQRPTDSAGFLPVLLSKGEVPERDIGAGERGQVLPFSIFFLHRLLYSANVLMQDLKII